MQQASLLSGRQMVMLVVVGLHALVFSALMAIRVTVERERGPVVEPITPLPRTEPPPRELPPRIVPDAMPRRPALDFPLPQPLFPDDTVAERVPESGPITRPAGEDGEAGPGEMAVLEPTPLAYRATRSPDDYYPVTSMRLQEEGTAIVRTCVGPGGRLEGRPQVERSSGSRRLDEAALAWVREALVFTPATRNGEAVTACKGFRVNFTLK